MSKIIKLDCKKYLNIIKICEFIESFILKVKKKHFNLTCSKNSLR